MSATVSEAAGQGILIGLGVAFAVAVPLISTLDKKYAVEAKTNSPSEFFSTGGRSLRMAFSATVICAQWIWSATFFFPPTNVWLFGITGAYWYGAGSCVQLLLMGIISYNMRRLAPKAHTLGELIFHRWGPWVHVPVCFLFVVQNLAIGGQLLQTAGTMHEVVTGVPKIEYYFLTPLLALPIILVGGIRGVMINSYIKNIVVFVTLCMLSFGVFTKSGSNGALGSMSGTFDAITARAEVIPIEGNRGGSYLTFWSHQGLVFAALNFFSGFPALFVEQNSWQYSIASRTSATNWSFFWGALLWFTIPWALGLTGLGALAANLTLTTPELFTGGVLTGVANALFGSAGVGLVAAAVWCGVSSGVSGEIIALSSIVTYDILPYFIRKPSESDRIRCLWITAALYSILSGPAAMVCDKIGWIGGIGYLSMGVTLSSPVAAIVLAVTSRRCTALAAGSSVIGGLAMGLMTWFVTAQGLYGEITLATMGMNYPLLAGSCVSLVLPFIIAFVVTAFKPGNYAWEDLAAAGTVEAENAAVAAPTKEEDEVKDFSTNSKSEAAVDSATAEAQPSARLKTFDRYNINYSYWAVGFTLLFMLGWPLLALPAGVWKQGYFTFFVVLCLGWLLIATFFATFWPLVQYRSVIVGVTGAWSRGARPSVLSTPSGKLEVTSK